ncbi:MAG: hypothetical protein WBE37_16150 [Bryobacteraceae bacterium]
MIYIPRAPGSFPAFPPPSSAWPVMAALQPAYLIPFPLPITTEPITIQVNVPASGSPVPLATAQTACCRIYVVVTAANTGLIFLGVPGLEQATGVNVMAVLAAYTSATNTTQGQWAAWCGSDEQLDLSDYVIDAAISGQGLSVTYWPR